MFEESSDRALMSITFYKISFTDSVVCDSGMLSKNFYEMSKLAWIA